MKNIEILITSLIVVLLGYVIYPKGDAVMEEPEIQDYFDDYPIEYWKDTDDGGDIVWVRYRILQDNTKLWVLDNNGNVIHQAPFELDRHDDGRDRIHKYRWKLYFTEWSSDIEPGDYQIVVGSFLVNTTNLVTDITI
tara:strand:+ start:539 stop:949 length:411 start_codon:yes stop_codon:yes gene_type:complete